MFVIPLESVNNTINTGLISSLDFKNGFVKNQTLSATPTANETATGVGLYIVKKYVDMMGGWLWLKRSGGKGTTFFVKFARSMS